MRFKMSGFTMIVLAVSIIALVLYFTNNFHSLNYSPMIELMTFTGG